MAPTTIAINGVPVETLGLTPSNLSGWLDGPAYGYQTSEVIGRYGQAVTGVNVTANPKVLKFTGYLQPASLAARRTALDALSKALTGRLEITTTDDPTRALYAYLTAMPVRTVGPALLSGQPQAFVDVTLTAFDPLWYDLTPQVMAIAAASTPAAFSTAGTAPYRRAQIVLNGAMSGTVTITLKDGTGATKGTLRLTGTLTSAEFLVLDLDPDVATITKWSAGVATDAITWLNRADGFGAFIIDPLDAPTIEASGTFASMLVTYYRSYWN